MGQLRAEVRRKEDATAAAQRSAKAERQITEAAHKLLKHGGGRYMEQQQQLTHAGTTPELAVPAGAPPQQQQQLAAASTSHKREAPAANKSRAAKQELEYQYQKGQIEKLQAELTEARASITSKDEQLASATAAPLDFQAVVAALMASSQSWVKALAADASAIFEEKGTLLNPEVNSRNIVVKTAQRANSAKYEWVVPGPAVQGRALLCAALLAFGAAQDVTVQSLDTGAAAEGAQLRSQVESLKKEIAEVKSINVQWQAKADEDYLKIQKCAGEAVEKDSTITRYTRLYQSQQAELDRLHEELKQAQTSLASKDAQLAAVSESGDQAASLQQCQDELEKKDVSIKKYADYYQYQRGQIEKLQAELTEAKASITSKDEQLASATAAPLDFQAVVAALMASSQSWVKALAADASAIFEELKTGKTEKIQVLAKSSLDAVRGAASSTVAFVRTEVDEHVPEPVKQKVMELFAQAKLLWQQNVIEAAWMKPLLEQLASLNAEVKKVLTDVLSKTPALAPYADPVSVQLAVYGVFGLPVLLVLVLPLALASRSKQAAQVIKAAFRGLVEAARPDLSTAQVDAVVAEVNKRRCAVGPGPRPTELCYWEGRPAMPKRGRPGQEWVYLPDKALLRKCATNFVRLYFVEVVATAMSTMRCCWLDVRVQTCRWAFMSLSGTFDVRMTVQLDTKQHSLTFSLLDSPFMKAFDGRWTVTAMDPPMTHLDQTARGVTHSPASSSSSSSVRAGAGPFVPQPLRHVLPAHELPLHKHVLPVTSSGSFAGGLDAVAAHSPGQSAASLPREGQGAGQWCRVEHVLNVHPALPLPPFAGMATTTLFKTQVLTLFRDLEQEVYRQRAAQQ
ncbi:hypothetical protein QJQ45_008403 [Haematococcus lacustris]|nr:hypothetical protein QJQ45_008403 [Haematococcus lacustris]